MISSVSDYKFVTNDLDKIIIDGGIMPLRDNPSVIRGEDITYPTEVRERIRSALYLKAASKRSFSRKIQKPTDLFYRENWSSIVPSDTSLRQTFGNMNGFSFDGSFGPCTILKSMIPEITGPEYIKADGPNHTQEALLKTKSLYAAFSSYFMTQDDVPELTGYPVLMAKPIRNMLDFVNSLRCFFFGRQGNGPSEFSNMTRFANGDSAYWSKSGSNVINENWDDMTVTFGRPNRQNCMQFIKSISLYAYMSFTTSKIRTRDGADQGSCAGGKIVKIADMDKIPGVDTIDQGLPQPYFKAVVPGSSLKSMFIELLAGSPAGYQSDRYSGGEYVAHCMIPGFVFVGSFSDDMFFGQ